MILTVENIHYTQDEDVKINTYIKWFPVIVYLKFMNKI